MPERNDEPKYPIDAISLLKADHRKVKDLFQQYQRAKGRKTKQNLADQICAELEIHAQLEETVFYPAFEGVADTAGEKLVEEARQEHQTVKDSIAELEEVHDRAFDAKFRELMHNVQHHVEEEEQKMFPKAAGLLADQLEDLMDEMVDLKQQLTTATRK